MPFDKIDIESITKERRKSVAKSIRPISIACAGYQEPGEL